VRHARSGQRFPSPCPASLDLRSLLPGAALPGMRTKGQRGSLKHVKLGDQAQVYLEEAFWLALKEIAAAEGCSMARLIRRVDSERRERFQKIFRQQPVSSSSIIIAVDAVLSGPTSVRKSSQPLWKATWVNAPAVRRAHGLGAEWLPWCPYHWRASGYQQRLKCPGGNELRRGIFFDRALTVRVVRGLS